MSSNTPQPEFIPNEPEPPDALPMQMMPLPPSAPAPGVAAPIPGSAPAPLQWPYQPLYPPSIGGGYLLPPSAKKKPPFNKVAIAAATAALVLSLGSLLASVSYTTPIQTDYIIKGYFCLGGCVLADLLSGLAMYFIHRSKGRQRGFIWAYISLLVGIAATILLACGVIVLVGCSKGC
jgi:hypothetical protein